MNEIPVEVYPDHLVMRDTSSSRKAGMARLFPGYGFHNTLYIFLQIICGR